MDSRGRSCPLAYRYQPQALAQPAQLEADTLYVVGGLYGNPAALAAVLERAHQEPGGPATIVFNGDFHWLDIDPDDFRSISETVLIHHATKGNVEAELAAGDDTAGCGCAYPDYVDDDVVDRSNQIITRLRATAGQFPELVGRLGELPRYLTASVGGERVGIVHGDPESLAGWRLALEAMEPGDPDVRRRVGWRGRPTTAAELLDWFVRAEVSVFASTHTGLPFAQVVADGRQRLVINNGSAGLANFADTTLWRHHAAVGQPPTSRRQLVRHHRRPPALRRVAGPLRPRPVDGSLPGPVAARQPRPRRLLRPHQRRYPSATGAGGTRRRRTRLALLIDGCRWIMAPSHRRSSM